MANILYGVNGEGAGHSTRSREVLKHLQQSGHEVHVASFDRGLQNLAGDFDSIEIHGLRFAFRNNRVRYDRTLVKNLFAAPKAARSIHRLMGKADEWQIDLVITDFEPLTCHIAHRRHLPVITIDNQHCLTHTDVTFPREFRRDAAAAKLVCRWMTPRTNASLITSFFTPRVKKKNTWLFPPILRREILQAKPTEGKAVLVYVTSPSPKLARALAQLDGDFVAYGFNREGREGKVVFKRPSLEGFLADLIECRAIIANAGFSLVTEALHLAKPYLAIPVEHQFEQTFNAYWLEKMGYGAWLREAKGSHISEFLEDLPLYREKLKGYPRSGNQALFDKLDELVRNFAGKKKNLAGA